eukprot:Tamp_05487.p1 GENE.Tamp_05487~~Tamp_05487.p1  ORF type:complete len:552 (-),score=176.11 Tamp_05487:184-1839(-)
MLLRRPKGEEWRRAVSMEEAEEEENELNIDDIVDRAEAVEVMDLSALKRAMAALEKKISKNQELRIKHADDPQKFLDSEIELFEEVNKLLSLATAPELYGEFVRLNGVQKLVTLLDHENTDIGLATVELINELTDPDALMDDEAAEQGAKSLVETLMDNSFPELLIKTLAKLDEADSDQQQGVYKVLAIVENLSEISPSALEGLCERTELVPWLLTRLQAKSKELEANKLYASEVLSILVANSSANQVRVGLNSGMDRLLGLCAAWKRKDPRDAQEAELILNVFNVVCSALLQPANQVALVEGEGVELMVIILQGRKYAARPALKVLDYALNRSANACDRFVAALGLKTLFPGFLKPATILASKSKETKSSGSTKEDEEHVVSILSALLLRLSGDAHARVVNKFIENDFEKLDKLLELHEKYWSQLADVKDVDPEDEEEDGEEEEETEEQKAQRLAARRYLRRLDKGLFTLQQVDTIIGFLLSEDIAAVNKRIRMLLNQMDADLKQVVDVMKEYFENLGGDAQGESSSDALNMKEVTGDLVDFLQDLSAIF